VAGHSHMHICVSQYGVEFGPHMEVGAAAVFGSGQATTSPFHLQNILTSQESLLDSYKHLSVMNWIPLPN